MHFLRGVSVACALILCVDLSTAGVTKEPVEDQTMDAIVEVDILQEPDVSTKKPATKKVMNLNGFDSLLKVFNFLSTDVDAMVNWAEFAEEAKKLHPRDLALIYSLDTVDLFIQSRDQIRQAKDYYDNSRSHVFSWCSYADNPLKFSADKLPAADQSGDKLAPILIQLFNNANYNFGGAFGVLEAMQESMSKAQKHFDQFMMEKTKEDEETAAKVTSTPKSTVNGTKPEPEDKYQKTSVESGLDYKGFSTLLKTANDNMNKISPAVFDFDPSTINYAEELKDKVNLVPKINELRDACSKYKSKHLQSSSKHISNDVASSS